MPPTRKTLLSDSVSSRVLRALRRGTSRKLSAFTLAELIVVVSILAVLATVGFLALSGYSGDARDATVKANVRSVATAISSESAATGNSPRYYVIHDPAYALSGAFAYVDGDPVALTGGDVGQPPADSNYTAGKPDYAKLKLDPEKFKVASSGLPGKTLALALAFPASVPGTPAHAAFDPASQMAAAFDSKSVAANGAPRNTGYFQVAGISPDTGAVSVAGNFPPPTPEESASGAVAGLLKNPNATGTDAGITAIADGENLNVAPLASCTLPWGGKVAHNAAVTAYQSATATFGTSCVSERRKCDDGALSGTFEVRNCSVTAAAACTLPWGGTVAHGTVATAYSEASIPFAAAYGCADRKQDRECVDGTLSGSVSYDKEACVKGEASPCAANASYAKNAHTYSVPLLAHAADSGNLTSADVNENHGVFRYSLTLSCNDGAYANENESGPAVVSCDSGYGWDSGTSACRASVNGTCGTAAKSYAYSASSYGSDTFCALGNGVATPASPAFPGVGASVMWTCGGSFGGSTSPTCTASRAVPADCATSMQTVNGHSYSVTAFNHGATATATSAAVAVTWGTQTHSQTFSCTDGTVATSGSETAGTVTCFSGYALIGGSCIPANCKVIKSTYPTSEDNLYSIDPDGTGGTTAFITYCDMTTDGGGWTLAMMSRENIVYWNTGISGTVTTQPNYDTWSYNPLNATVVNPTTNSTNNVVTKALTTVPFQDFLFRCSGDSTYCGTDNHSVYSHTTSSLLSAKTGTLTQKTATGWPFSRHRVYTTSYVSDPSYLVPINSISLSAQCAPASSRPYSACVRIGVVGRDYYDFQNAVGLGMKGSESYSESISVNTMLGYMAHRSFVVLRGDVYVR